MRAVSCTAVKGGKVVDHKKKKEMLIDQMYNVVLSDFLAAASLFREWSTQKMKRPRGEKCSGS